ncbi:Imm52 family immunity protein [Streptomyces sp. NPDC000151]|uniref:Imm52 family immunity protein n=1 Tax=Streptomyces sp. NPDC000151 TaxID=3154244 RepID=UPI00331B9EBB
MTLDLTVGGVWGPRQESPDQLAERWLRLLRRLARIAPEDFAGWRAEAVGQAEQLPENVDADWFASYLSRVNPQDDAATIGYSAVLVAARPGRPIITLCVGAGGTPQFAPQTAVITIRSADLNDSAPLVARLPEVLTAIAEEWDADWGDIADDDLLGALEKEYELDNSTPRCGRAVYLSSGRRALIPEDVPGRRSHTEHGGLVIDLGRPDGTGPDADHVLAVNGLLRKAGALEELPYPMDRAKW